MTTPTLPAVRSETELDAFMADTEAVDAALRRVCDRLRIDEPLRRPARGSAIVGVGQGEVVKLMSPLDAALARTERTCLSALHGALPTPTPELLDAGEIDGWSWCRMSRLPGQELLECWPALAHADRLSLAAQLGETLAVLHGLEPPAEIPRVDWAAWRGERTRGLVETQRARGCPVSLLESLERVVGSADLSEGRAAWLHTEVMLQHLLVEQSSRGWRLSGLFDFEPSQVGPAHYEFAAVGLFVSEGDPRILAAVCDAYGERMSPERLLGMACMHRYANLGWYHRRLGGPLEAASLAEAWFGVNPAQ